MTCKERRDYWKSVGLCSRCGRNPASPGMKMCDACHEKNRKDNKARYDFLKARGLCVTCYKEKVEPGHTRCAACLGRARMRDRLAQREANAN